MKHSKLVFEKLTSDSKINFTGSDACVEVGQDSAHPTNGDERELRSGSVQVELPIWDRCYDFLNIFAKKIGEKIGVFDSKQS
jgi:hypothetical protein